MRGRVLCLLLAVVLLFTVFAGCGARTKSEDRAASFSRAEAPMKAENGRNQSYDSGAVAEAKADAKPAAEPEMAEEAYAAEDATAITGSGSASQSVSNAVLAQRKIIRNANVTVEVDNFDVAYGKINTFILGTGYISQSNISTEKVYVDKEQKLVKRGVIVVRVDKEKFDKVLSDIKGLGSVLNEITGTDDVTEKYFDVESRLRLLRFEESRLEEYLKKLNDPDTIFKTESRLTDIRHEIEGLTGTLRKLNDLIELSTITININEKVPGYGNSEPPKPKGYGDRLLGNFLDSIKGAVNFCGELLIILVQALPVLILLGAFVLLVLFIYRKISRNSVKNVIKKDE